MVENSLSLAIDLDTPKQVWKVLEDMFIQSKEKLKVMLHAQHYTYNDHNKPQ